MMTDLEIRHLAHQIVLEASSNEKLLEKVAEMIRRGTKKPRHLVTHKQAAEILGISPWQLYRIKDYPDGRPRFTYIKRTGKRSSNLKYNADTLVEEYERYCRESGGVKQDI